VRHVRQFEVGLGDDIALALACPEVAVRILVLLKKITARSG